MRRLKQFSLLLVFVLVSVVSWAQSAISAKVFPITFNYKTLRERELGTQNSNSPVGFEPGIMLAYEQYISSRKYSVKANQGVFVNSNKSIASFSQLNFRYRWYHRKHAVSFGVGPSFFVKQNKGTLDNGYTDSGAWQYQIKWFSGEIEYAYYLNSSWRAVVSVNNPSPNAISLSAGLKLFLKAKAKSCNCPSFGKYK